MSRQRDALDLLEAVANWDDDALAALMDTAGSWEALTERLAYAAGALLQALASERGESPRQTIAFLRSRLDR